jgi:hypothetical protein
VVGELKHPAAPVEALEPTGWDPRSAWCGHVGSESSRSRWIARDGRREVGRVFHNEDHGPAVIEDARRGLSHTCRLIGIDRRGRSRDREPLKRVAHWGRDARHDGPAVGKVDGDPRAVDGLGWRDRCVDASRGDRPAACGCRWNQERQHHEESTRRQNGYVRHSRPVPSSRACARGSIRVWHQTSQESLSPNASRGVGKGGTRPVLAVTKSTAPVSGFRQKSARAGFTRSRWLRVKARGRVAELPTVVVVPDTDWPRTQCR